MVGLRRHSHPETNVRFARSSVHISRVDSGLLERLIGVGLRVLWSICAPGRKTCTQ